MQLRTRTRGPGGHRHRPIGPGLEPLANYGGPTETHALRPDSPAVDAGDDAVVGLPLVLDFDQRGPGFPRQVDGNGDGTPMVDIGAFEAEPGPPPVPTGFLVNSNLDTVDTTPGDGVCADAAGNCTLRAAIQETNALPGADTITLPADTYTLSIPGIDEDAAESGDLDITDDLTINGGGADTAIIDGGALDRVFDIAPGSATDISGVTVRNGSSSGGGGIGNEGTLTLNNSTLSGNTGRGISSTGTVTINNSTVSGNTGRGIANAGTMTIDNSTVSGNSGGGIFNSGSGVGTMTLVNSTVSGNTKATGNGGGIFNSGTMTVTNSTVSGNETAHIEAQGGGIANSGTLTLTNSTVSGNLALTPFGGGGIFSSGGTVNVKNTIIAGNSDLLGEGPDCVGTLTSQGHNLVQAPFGCTITGDPTGNITGEDPLLGPLQDNGGPTFTHALLEESRAIDAGDDAVLAEPFLLEFDQRGPGFPRQLDGKGDGTPVVDIGAFELEAEPAADTPQTSPLTVNKTEDTDDGLCGTLDCSLRRPSPRGLALPLTSRWASTRSPWAPSFPSTRTCPWWALARPLPSFRLRWRLPARPPTASST